jgi:hypothetical protein
MILFHAEPQSNASSKRFLRLLYYFLLAPLRKMILALLAQHVKLLTASIFPLNWAEAHGNWVLNLLTRP